MTWLAISSSGVGPLCYAVDAAVYQDVYEHLMLPSAEMLSGDADLIFQQDMAPAGKKPIPA